MLECETGQSRDLDGQAFVLGVEAVDERWDHDGELGFLAELFLSADDGEVDLAVGSVIGERVNFGSFVIVVDVVCLGVVPASGKVCEEGSSRCVDEER